MTEIGVFSEIWIYELATGKRHIWCVGMRFWIANFQLNKLSCFSVSPRCQKSMNTLRKALPRTFIATAENCAQILSVTNEAFMADAFFKKPEYHLRFDTDTVLDMIKAPNSAFILATFDKADITSPEVCGSIFFNWTSELQSNEDNSFDLKVCRTFYMI
jgi:hypothetical protein